MFLLLTRLVIRSGCIRHFRSAYVDLDAMPKEFFDRWEMPGDEKLTNIPAISDAYYSYHHRSNWFFSLQQL